MLRWGKTQGKNLAICNATQCSAYCENTNTSIIVNGRDHPKRYWQNLVGFIMR